ncbi:MAG: heme ABC exporter ATP-binding protein CcmA [Chloroflexi bacterium]|nr:heme ABC exporter ATP-binding protein CcmA [Chloroflexota bacterium]
MPVMQSTAAIARAGAPVPSARLDGAVVALGDRVILRGVAIEVLPGITVLRGPNGSGKTTALRALAGLVPLLRGSVDVAGDLLYLGHRPQLVHGLTARENLAFFAAFRERRADVGVPLRSWGLGADADRPVEQLSAGQRRRAALARIESERCDILLLDEPFAELDDEAVARLQRALRDSAGGGAAVLIASHGHADLDRDARRVYLMHDGEVQG